MSDELLIRDEDGVRTLALNRPARMNALNNPLVEALQGALHAASADDAVRVVVVTGEGGSFCAGLDLQAAMAEGLATFLDPTDELGWVGRQALAVVGCAKPVIAAISGPAVGAGLGLALAADLRYMVAEGYVAAGYVRRALSPDAGVSFFLPRLVPPTVAMEILLTGRRVSGAECERLGLVNGTFESVQALNEAVGRVARSLADGPALALRRTKRLVHASLARDLRAHLQDEWQTIQEVAMTEDVGEAIAAFLARREPVFRGS